MSRPKGARNVRTIVHELARERVAIRTGEKERQVPLVEALLLLLQHLAMKGSIAADKALDRLRTRSNPEPPPQGIGVLLVPEPLATDEWTRQAEIRNRFAEPPEMPDDKVPGGPPGSTGPGDAPVQKANRNRSPAQPWPISNMRGRLIR